MDSDDSLKPLAKNKAPATPSPGTANEAAQVEQAQVVKDLRGAACPMNFVKTKMALATMQTGQLLRLFLDDGEPIRNVPRSVADEGHRVIEQTRVEDYWSVLIEKR